LRHRRCTDGHHDRAGPSGKRRSPQVTTSGRVLHRIALTQARCHPEAKTMIARRKAGGDSGLEALRVLKRRLSDVVYRALLADLQPKIISAAA
jgi:ribosomal protein S4